MQVIPGSRKAPEYHEPHARPLARHVLAFSLAALVVLGLTAHPAYAQTTLTPANSNVGAPGGGNQSSQGVFFGNNGSDGYFASGSGNNFIVNGPILTGGSGGAVTGTDPTALQYSAGKGGNGLSVFYASATVNSGTFTGGIGGAVNGVGKLLVGGRGGDGLQAYSSTTNVYGGTFLGGDSGTVPATGGVIGGAAPIGGGAGSGLNAEPGSRVNVFGGSFTGGNDTVSPFASDTYGGSGLYDLGGTLNVYGGSFTGSNNGFGAVIVQDGNLNIYGGSFTGNLNGNGKSGLAGLDLDAFGGATTLYGSDFTVNGITNYSGPVTGSGTLTSILQNNGAISTIAYSVYGSGTLNISAPTVPEASTTVSFGLLLALGLGGLVVAARRKKIAP